MFEVRANSGTFAPWKLARTPDKQPLPSHPPVSPEESNKNSNLKLEPMVLSAKLQIFCLSAERESSSLTAAPSPSPEPWKDSHCAPFCARSHTHTRTFVYISDMLARCSGDRPNHETLSLSGLQLFRQVWPPSHKQERRWWDGGEGGGGDTSLL